MKHWAGTALCSYAELEVRQGVLLQRPHAAVARLRRKGLAAGMHVDVRPASLRAVDPARFSLDARWPEAPKERRSSR